MCKQLSCIHSTISLINTKMHTTSQNQQHSQQTQELHTYLYYESWNYSLSQLTFTHLSITHRITDDQFPHKQRHQYCEPKGNFHPYSSKCTLPTYLLHLITQTHNICRWRPTHSNIQTTEAHRQLYLQPCLDQVNVKSYIHTQIPQIE